MKMTRRLALMLALSTFAAAQMPATTAAHPAFHPGVLTREMAATVLPATVFYRGQSAPTQARNSAGIAVGEGEAQRLMLTALVDTSGYSTSIQQTYQAYLLTEMPLSFGEGKTLPAGAYGYGIVNGEMLIMDISGHELLRVPATRDAEFVRPTPLQIIADPANGSYRLYLGRNYVVLNVGTR